MAFDEWTVGTIDDKINTLAVRSTNAILQCQTKDRAYYLFIFFIHFVIYTNDLYFRTTFAVSRRDVFESR